MISLHIYLETRSLTGVQASLKLMAILLFQFPKYWNYECVLMNS